MFELEEVRPQKVCIKVVGVGGAGGNVINNMIASSIKVVQYIAINTDSQALDNSLAPYKVHIGTTVTRGLGAGSKPEIGKEAALEDRTKIAEALEGADMVFITAGMGGGTGTGASPIVAEVAREIGALAVAVVTKPFFYEGAIRMNNAQIGLTELEKNIDALIVIPNDRISFVAEKGAPLLDAFALANNVLKNAVQGIADVILKPGLINVDFADVRTVMEHAGRVVMGIGVGRGDSRAIEAAKRAISNPLLEDTSIEDAKGILVNITGGLDLSHTDLGDIMGLIYDSVDRKKSNIKMGAIIDADLREEIRVTVIASGINGKENIKVEPKRYTPKAINLRASERVLSKKLASDEPHPEAMPYEEPLDVPTFLRKIPRELEL